MMGELSRLPEPEPIRHPLHARGCRISQFLADLDEEDQTLVRGYVADRSLSDRAVAEWFNLVAKVDVHKTTVRQHRAGDCCGGVGKIQGRGSRG